MNVAIIPARGGSKRIPGKNIKLFVGRPIIFYSIQAAQKAGVFDRIIVSTDSDEIADVARKSGAEVPFMRPKELSDDMTPTALVLQHAIRWLEESDVIPYRICCIYATAPFVLPGYLRAGLEEIERTNVSSVFSVASFEFPILRGLKWEADGHLSMMWPEYELTRSNDLPEAYHDAGQFYWLSVPSFLESGRLYGADARPVLIPRHLVQVIDTSEDWEQAELMYEICKKKGHL